MTYDKAFSRNRRSAREWKSAAEVKSLKTISPACPSAGASQRPPGAGEQEAAPPRSPLTKGEEAALDLEAIAGSNDVQWLRRVMCDADNPMGKRNAAECRLKRLVKKPRL